MDCNSCGTTFNDDNTNEMEAHAEKCKSKNLEEDLIGNIAEYIERCKLMRTQADRMKIVSEFAHYFTDIQYFLTFEDTQDIYIFNPEEGIYQNGGNQFIRREFQRLIDKAKADDTELSKYTTINTINEIIDTIRRLTMRKRDEIEPPLNLVCLANGILNMDTLQIEPFNHKYYFMSKLATQFDKDATCPNIDKFLKEVLDEKDITIVEEIVGACLVREDLWQKAVCAFGEGANGKSTLIGVIVAMLGRNNIASVSLQELEEDKFAVANLYSKHANLIADMSANDLKSTAKFKSCLGGDVMRAQNKNGHPFFFKNHAKFFISCNRLPKSPDNTMAFFRRLILLHFSRSFDGKEDRGLMARLTTAQELSGLLNRAVGGYSRLKQTGQYSYDTKTEAIIGMYLHLSDSAASFFTTQMETNEEDEGISKEVVWNTYLKFCKDTRVPRVSEKLFWESIREHYIITEYRAPKEYDELRRRMIRGIKFKPTIKSALSD